MAKGSKTIAKTAGKAKGSAKALSGYPGIFRHLAAEHGEVAALMRRVAGSSQDSDLREQLFPEIRRSLLAHTQAEEKEFYAPLSQRSDLRELVWQATEEHRKVEEYLEKLSTGNKATKTWLETFERMQRAVEDHVDMEESQLFPAAKEALSREEARQMLERYETAEEEAKSQL